MMNFYEHVVLENYPNKTPQECIRHAIHVLQSSHVPSNALKSIAILSLYALFNSTSDRKIKSMVPTLLSHLTDL